jgi:hypothetical protein
MRCLLDYLDYGENVRNVEGFGQYRDENGPRGLHERPFEGQGSMLGGNDDKGEAPS